MAEPAPELPLLFASPQPPLSHCGATLLRHVVATGLRYSLHQLGLPLPERPPLRIRGLRLELDEARLRRMLAGSPPGELILEAMTSPGDSGPPPTAHLAGSLFFHRLRLRLRPRNSLLPVPLPTPEAPAPELEGTFRRQLARLLPSLRDALLAEVIAAVDRRAARHGGRPPAAGLGREASRFRAGRPCALDRLGPPDLLEPSWGEAGVPGGVKGATRPSRVDRRRGRFRESWRGALHLLRPHILRLAAAAVDRQILEGAEDAFFLPFELLGDLSAESRPDWLPTALLRNRQEYESTRRAAPEGERRLWPGLPLEPLS